MVTAQRHPKGVQFCLCWELFSYLLFFWDAVSRKGFGHVVRLSIFCFLFGVPALMSHAHWSPRILVSTDELRLSRNEFLELFLYCLSCEQLQHPTPRGHRPQDSARVSARLASHLHLNCHDQSILARLMLSLYRRRKLPELLGICVIFNPFTVQQRTRSMPLADTTSVQAAWKTVLHLVLHWRRFQKHNLCSTVWKETTGIYFQSLIILIAT